MNYFILRNGQQYGPYSPANLQLYLSLGSISLNDLGRTDELNEWLPLAQIVGKTAPSPASNGTLSGDHNVQPMPPPSLAPLCSGFPGPPGLNTGGAAPLPPGWLHWAVLLLLALVTLGLFGAVWTFVQAIWVRKIDEQSKAIFYLAMGIVLSLMGAVSSGAREYLIALPVLLAGFVFLYAAVFSMRASIERYCNTVEPRGLRLSLVMTFFFGIFYLQYHLHRILKEKRAARLAAGPVSHQYARPA